MNKTKVKMNKPVFLAILTFHISKIVMYEYWCDYLKQKYGCSIKLCYMDTDNTKDVYGDLAKILKKDLKHQTKSKDHNQ